MSHISAEAVVTLAGALAVDRWLGEPPGQIHPVVWIGRAVAFLADRAPSGVPGVQLAAGSAIAALVISASAAGGWLAGRIPGGLLIRLPLRIWLLSSAFAGQELLTAVRQVESDLAGGDLVAARNDLRSLVSRPTEHLDDSLIAAAAIESAAENSSDSFVAPLLAFTLAGLPGALAYRAINTLDAMLGYRGHLEYLGKASARLDDLANFVPARLTALMIAGCSGSRAAADRSWRIARRDAGRTASPNAGWPMAAMAGALGVELVKVGHYRLGDALRPTTLERLQTASTITSRVLTLAAALALFGSWVRDAA